MQWKAWKHFVEVYLKFESDPRNVRLNLCDYEFTPYIETSIFPRGIMFYLSFLVPTKLWNLDFSFIKLLSFNFSLLEIVIFQFFYSLNFFSFSSKFFFFTLKFLEYLISSSSTFISLISSHIIIQTMIREKWQKWKQNLKT